LTCKREDIEQVVFVYSEETEEGNGDSKTATRTYPQDAQDDPLSGSTVHVRTRPVKCYEGTCLPDV